MTRAVSILLGAGVAGVLIWTTAQVHRGSTGGYWGEMALLGVAGLVLGISRLTESGSGGRVSISRSTFAIAFLPALVAAGWVIVAGQPNSSWLASHVTSWSDDIGVDRVVSDASAFAGVLAFGLGVVLSFAVERRRIAVVETIHERTATAEPAPAPNPIEEHDREPELVGPADGR
jgi:hypothetical protein